MQTQEHGTFLQTKRRRIIEIQRIVILFIWILRRIAEIIIKIIKTKKRDDGIAMCNCDMQSSICEKKLYTS